MAFNKVVPGQVINNGIGDGSLPATALNLPSYPCHYTNITVVTPKGKLGQQYINLADFASLYGDIQDPDSPYYNAISRLLVALGSGGQASIGVRRVTGNTKYARVAVGVSVGHSQSVPQYERNADGSFKYDANGSRILLEGTAVPGVYIIPTIIDVTADGVADYGQLVKKEFTQTVNGEEITFTQYPFYELPAGIGDAYNKHGVLMGVDSNVDWGVVSSFVESTGTFPYTLKMYVKSDTGVPAYYPTTTGSVYSTYTLFSAKDEYDVRYSLKAAVGDFTGDNVNRVHQSRPAPFSGVYVYTKNIQDVCSAMYDVEHAAGKSDLVTVTGVQAYNQMNPLTLVNHNGVPYHAIVSASDTNPFYLGTSIDAKGGISPFLTADRKPAATVEGTYNFDPAANNGVEDKLSMKDAWTVSQSLILADLETYINSLEINDWTRNRQSVIWDVGYNTDIKNALVKLLNVRKDQIAVFQASVWLENMTVAQRYSLMQSLTTKLRLNPESTLYGTPACRAAISLWDAKIIDENTGEDFALTIDLAYQFAKLGGNAKGRLASINSPDHAAGRIITIMHTPTITFEGDDAAANNFDEGGISLRPYDESQYYRPALPTVTTSNNGVLKDLMTVFTCICIEKLGQDSWTLVSGDTTMDSTVYASTVKDQIESAARDRMGTMFKEIRVTCSYDETSANSRSVMSTLIEVSFRKGKYMMDMSLMAYNEQDTSLTS